ncbi:MAG: hypothetical protein QHC90_05505 [Shinella sp.]|nr:hypothetical protein [Shinella sp.]
MEKFGTRKKTMERFLDGVLLIGKSMLGALSQKGRAETVAMVVVLRHWHGKQRL